MNDETKIQDESLSELEALRARVAKLERAEAQREQALAALRQSEERFRLAVLGTSDGLWDWNILTGEIWWSPRCKELIGYKDDELSTSFELWESLLHPDDVERTQEAIRRHISDGRTYDIEYRLKTKSGEYRWFHARGVAARGKDDKPVHMAGSIRDITERKRVEQALRESEEKYRQLFATGTDAIIVFDVDTQRILDANPAAQKLYEYSKEEFLKMQVVEISAEPEKTAAATYAAAKGNLAKITLRYHRNKRGTAFPVEISPALFKLKGRNVVGGIIRDITERKQAEEKFRTADRLAATGTMVAGVAHEINTPLTVISGLAELLAKNRGLDAKARESAQEIVEQVARCAKIVGDLLLFSRTGRVSIQAVHVNELAARCVSFFRDTHRFDDVEIIEEYDTAVPETMVDPYRVEQVFINIIRNAGDMFKDAPSPKRLTVRSKRLGDRIRLEFTDTGPGIANVDRVFDPFYTTKETGEGAGLGLSVSLGVIHDLGGDLTAENTEEGARFTVTLPIRLPPSSPVQTSRQPRQPGDNR